MLMEQEKFDRCNCFYNHYQVLRIAMASSVVSNDGTCKINNKFQLKALQIKFKLN